MLLSLDGALVCEEFDAEYGDAALPGEMLVAIVSAAMGDGGPTRFSRAIDGRFLRLRGDARAPAIG